MPVSETEPSPRSSPGVREETAIFPPEVALCLKCNYSLRGLTSHRCPECGREFDPRDPTTMKLGGRIQRMRNALCGPISPLLRTVQVAAAIAILWGAAWLP